MSTAGLKLRIGGTTKNPKTPFTLNAMGIAKNDKIPLSSLTSVVPKSLRPIPLERGERPDSGYLSGRVNDTTSQAGAANNRISPSFRLRGVDVEDIKERYLRGDFNIITVSILKLEKPVTKIALTRAFSENEEDESHMMKLGSVKHSVISEAYNPYRECLDGKDYEEIKDKYCKWCLDPITISSLSIPLKLVIKDDIKHYQGLYCYGSYNCAYSHLSDMLNRPIGARSPHLINSLNYLLSMYYAQYPENEGKGIRLVPPPSYRKCFGGPLTDDEYYSNTYIYVPNPNIKFHLVNSLIERIKVI